MTGTALPTKEQWKTLIDNVAIVETTLQALAVGELSGSHESVQEASALLKDVRQALHRHERSGIARPVDQHEAIEPRVCLEAQLLDSMCESVVATDLDDDVIYWGKGAAALYGYDVDKVMGRSVRFIVDPEEMDAEEQRVRRVRKMGSWRGRSARKRSDGSRFWADTSISLATDETGHPIGLLIIDRDISEHVRAEEALCEREAFYRTFFEESPIGLEQEDWSDAKAEIDRLREQGLTDFRSYFEEHRAVAVDIVRSAKLVDANQMALHLRGLQSKSDVLGRVVDSPGSSLENLIANLVDFAEGTRMLEFDWIASIAAGEERHRVIRLSIPSNYEDTWKQVLVCMVDVTERRRAEQALRQSEAQYRTLFEAIPVGVGLSGYDGRILACNEAMSRLFGWSQAELEGLNLVSAYHDPEERSRLLERLRTEGRLHDFEVTLKRMDGTPWHANLQVTPFVSDGDDVLLTVAVDTTERRRVQEELQRFREQLEDLVEERTAGLARANEQLRQEIVERKRVEESLRQSEARASALLDAIPDLMFRIAGDGTYLDFRAAPGCVPAYPPDEFLGRRILELAPPAEAERTMNHIQQALQTGETQHFEYELVVDDITRYYEARVAVSGGNEVVALVRDITDRKQAEDALRASEERLRLLAEAAPVALLLASADGTVEYASPATESILGRACESLIGTREIWKEVVHPEDRERVTTSLQRQGVQQHHLEFRTKHPDGSVRWLLGNVIPVLTEAGEIHRFVAAVTDITERKWAEERVIRSAKLASMGLLASGIAHEMRNPLGVISACSQLMLESPDDAELRRQGLEKTQAAVWRASRIIEDLLRFARPAPAKMTNVDVNAVVDETLGLLLDHLALHKVSVERESEPGVSVIKGSSQLLQQVFSNLILNACAAMPDGGQLTVTTRADEAREVRVEFCDTGIGISSEHLDRIFEPFFTTRAAGKGLGLGLAISYRVIQQHHGNIQVESRVGQGTTFTVCLPRNPDDS